MRDPYEMLRRAREIIASPAKHHARRDDVAQWLQDYQGLPGAALSEEEVHVLRNSNLRTRDNRKIVDTLLGAGYLDTISNVRRSGTTTHVRCSTLGREALRLREDVPQVFDRERYTG